MSATSWTLISIDASRASRTIASLFNASGCAAPAGAPCGFGMRVRSLLARTPAFVVRLAHLARIGHRRDPDADFELLVTLDSRLSGPAVLLTPHHGQLLPDIDVRIHDTQREGGSLVVAVPTKHREANHVALPHDLVIRGGRVVRVRQVVELVVLAVGPEKRGVYLRHVVPMPGEGHLLAMRLVCDLLQRFATDEVVVELDERAVAELVRREVIVLDIVRDEAAADRASGFVARRRQPFAVLLHLLAGVNRGQRRGNPTRLERVAGVGASADLNQAEIPARLQDRLADLVALCVGAPDLEARRAGHAMP